MEVPPVVITFDAGSLVVRGASAEDLAGVGEYKHDPRVGAWRLPAWRYRELVTRLHRAGRAYEDRARAYPELSLAIANARTPLAHQAEALAAWTRAGMRGVVVLPTGSGKTYLGILAIAQAQRGALVVTPTLDLVAQWARELEAAFGAPIGMVGGQVHDYQPITVTTYASAHRIVEHTGDRYGLLVFDECHHLPGPVNAFAARGALAPFRLGLTATLERPDGAHAQLDTLIGPLAFRNEIDELSGVVLSPYRVETIEVELDADERARYEETREIYRDFVERAGIRVGSRGGWNDFLRAAARSVEGRLAYDAFREQKRITRHAEGKLVELGRLFDLHARDRAIVFTADNEAVYAIARRFLVPALTHQTKLTERRRLLAGFAAGDFPVLVTSQVLNEGVDVPEARVGIVISGTGSVREHVQRLGRILRRAAGKEAVLYEILTKDTAERYTSERRRDHVAYRSVGAGPQGDGVGGAMPGGAR